MPRRLTGVVRRKNRTLADLDIAQLLAFEVGWDTPEEQWEEALAQVPEMESFITREQFIAGEKSRSSWISREDCMGDYHAVRDELLAQGEDLSKWFAETLWQEQHENR